MQLNQTNPDYGSLLYIIPLPSLIYELETFQILDVNQAAIDHYGYSKTDFLRLTVKDICLGNEIPHLITLHSEIEIHARNFSLGVFTHQKHSGDQIRVKIKGQKINYQGRESILAVAQDVTEEENRIEQLLVSEERFKIAQEISPDGFTILRPLRNEKDEVVDFMWVFENQAIANINGTNKNNVIGKRLLDLFPSHRNTMIFDSYIHVANNKESKIIEDVYVGEILSLPTWLRLVIVPMGDDIAILTQNITESKTANEAVRESEARFRTIFDIASLGIAQVDPTDGQIILVNAYYETITGYQTEELLKMKCVNLTHPDDREKDWELFSKAARGEGEYRNEKRYIKKDGSIVWVRLHLAFNRDEMGQPLRTVAICEEITGRKEAELQLQNLADNIPGVAFQHLLFPDGTDALRSVSKGARQVWGYSPEEVMENIQLVWNQTKAGGDFEAVGHSIMTAIKTKTKWAARYKSVLPSGEVQMHLGSGTPNFLADGTILFNSVVLDITQEARYEELLAQASKLARIGSWEVDFVQNRHYWSDMVHELHETDPKKFVPNLDTAINFYREDFHELVQTSFERSKSTGEGFDFEAILVTALKNERWVRAIGNAEIVDGQCKRIYGSFQDIHELKVAAENLENAYKEKNSILERIGDAFFALDKDWKVTYWNKRAEEIIGIPREDLIGYNLWEKFPLAKDLEFFKQYERAFKTQTPINFQEYFQPFNQWYEANGYPSPEGISVFFRDITDNKIAEKKILAANERFEKVTEATNDAIWDYDLLTNDLFWGKGFYTLFGYNPDETKPSFEVLLSLIHDEDKAHIVDQVNKYMADPILKDWYEEYRFLKADGTYAFVIDRAIFIRNSEGKVIRVIGAMNDITQRKDFEQQLISLNKSLKQNAHDLELSNELLEQFAYIASHDLQEPLRMITSFMDQLKRKYQDKLDDKALQYIYFASDGAKRMKQIILDLLEYSRAGRLAESRETVDLNDLLNEYQLLRRKIISEKSVEFDMKNLPVLRCYKAPMIQTFHSLLDNAINYSKPGVSPRITIVSEEMGGFCKISIADNGIGIEPKFFDKIFIIFQRLHNREKYDGTGIGLSIAKKNIESWGGKIWLESTPGEGSTFYFSIPKLE